MPQNFPGDASEYPLTIQAPVDGDTANAASVATGLAQLADRTANLNARVPVNLSNATPANVGAATAGTGLSASREDHVHDLPTTGVVAGTYGTATKGAQVTFDAKGRATSAAEVDLFKPADFGEMTAPATPGANTARVYAEDVNGLTVLRMKDATGLVTQFVRDEVVVVRNTSGGPLVKGDAVYISGATGSVPNVAKAYADGVAFAASGILAENIANNGFGRMMVAGELRHDTSAFDEGDLLYLQTTPGTYSDTPPAAPAARQVLGVVTVSGVGNGEILVRIQAPQGAIDASFVTTGTLASARLPTATTSAKGAIQLDTLGDTAKFLNGNGAWTTPSNAAGTPQDVSTATVLSGTDDKTVYITGTFNGAITLPAASGRKGQRITVIDAAGVGSGDANGASENIIYVVVSNTGTETITGGGLYTGRTRLMLWKRYGTLTLVSDGSAAWRVTQRSYWHVDPRTISGLECWFDSRKGITLSGNNVTAWADISGNNVDVLQGTAANQPQYRRAAFGYFTPEGGENVVFYADNTDTLTSTGTISITSGSVNCFAVYSKNFSETGTGNQASVFATAQTSTLGFRWYVHTQAAINAGAVAAAGDWAVMGAGTGTNTPYASGTRMPTDYGYRRTVQFATAGAGGTTNLRSDGSPVIRTISNESAVPNFTQTISVGVALVFANIQTIILYDALLVAADLYDLERALRETFETL